MLVLFFICFPDSVSLHNLNAVFWLLLRMSSEANDITPNNITGSTYTVR